MLLLLIKILQIYLNLLLNINNLANHYKNFTHFNHELEDLVHSILKIYYVNFN